MPLNPQANSTGWIAIILGLSLFVLGFVVTVLLLPDIAMAALGGNWFEHNGVAFFSIPILLISVPLFCLGFFMCRRGVRIVREFGSQAD